MQPAMLRPVSIRNRTGSFGWSPRQEKQPRRNSALDRRLRQPRRRWWLRWPTSARWRRPRKPSWSGCAGADSAMPNSETMSGQRKLAGSCSCRDHSAFLARVKWMIFRLVNLWMTIGVPPVFRQDLLKWATKSTSLACENLMIAAEALGLNTCPMEGFDGRRLSRFLGLSTRYHEIVMVIAIGKKSPAYTEPPQWRRPLDATVTVL